MSGLFTQVSLGTNLFAGYGLTEALDMACSWGFDKVELSIITGICEHIAEEDLTEEKAAWLLEELRKRNMQIPAVSGHQPDITQEDQFEIFMKKLAFAGRLGAKIININAGVRGREAEFYRLFPKAIDLAEKYGIVIGLESHGDIVNTAADSIEVFKYFHHPLVRYNYDFGNTKYFNGADFDVAEDVKIAFDYIANIHFKDVVIRPDYAAYVPIGDGCVEYERVFESLRQLGRPVGCGLEIPVALQGTTKALAPTGIPLPEAVMRDAAYRSVDYVSSVLGEKIAELKPIG